MVEKSPEKTRRRILEAAFEEMYERGYQGMRLDKVLEQTGLTKGALYHHFPNKHSLALTVVEEMGCEYIEQNWSTLINAKEDVIEGLQFAFQEQVSMHPEMAEKGCPLNNLAQEMSGIDDKFNERIQQGYGLWIACLAEALERGQTNGQVKAEIDPTLTATYIISSFHGIFDTLKCFQSETLQQQLLSMFDQYIESLRP